MPEEAAGQVQMASEAEGQQVGLDYVGKPGRYRQR